MSHFAKIEDEIVTQVIVAEQDFINTQEGTWVQTSYNTYGNTHVLGGTPLRGNFAAINGTYNSEHDVFIPPKPYNSWTLNTYTWLWESPVPLPDNAGEISYEWNETTLSWEEINNG